MKYSKDNPPIYCEFSNSIWYKEAVTGMHPIGVLWHDTGCNNATIKRYAQPSEDDPHYNSLLQIIGVNRYKNDWNHTDRKAGVHAFIGKLADDSIGTVQTSSFDRAPWGCGSGVNGSCNGYDKDHVYHDKCWV